MFKEHLEHSWLGGSSSEMSSVVACEFSSRSNRTVPFLVVVLMAFWACSHSSGKSTCCGCYRRMRRFVISDPVFFFAPPYEEGGCPGCLGGHHGNLGMGDV